MTKSRNPLKVVLAVRHFLPNFKAGVEWHAHHDYVVKVVYIESICDTQTDNLRWVDEQYNSLTIHRLFLNLSNIFAFTRWEYDNPGVEAHLTEYLAEDKPDIFYLLRGYFWGRRALRAARTVNDPISAEIVEQEVQDSR